MDAAIHVLHGVIDNLMRVIAFQSFVGKQCVGVQGRTSFDMFSHFCLQFFLFAACNNAGANLSTALKNSHDGSLIFAACACNPALAFADVHIARLATDESLVRLNFGTGATDLDEGFGLYGETNAVHHEPSRLLGNAEISAYFVAANPILA